MMLKNISGSSKALVFSVVAFLVLYFGFSKISPEVRSPEKSGSNVIENNFEQQALNLIDSLSESNKSQISLYYQQLEKATNDSVKSMILQRISGFWYQNGQIGLSAEYAREVAKLISNSEAWSIAATNYVLAIKQGTGTDAEKTAWIEKAKDGFEKAILLDSGNITYKVNKALLSVEFPPQNQPMEGILGLRALNEKYPDNPVVLYHLGRLAIETNQLDRAKERLQHLIKVNPDYFRAYCLLAQIAEKEKNEQALKLYNGKCKDE